MHIFDICAHLSSNAQSAWSCSYDMYEEADWPFGHWGCANIAIPCMLQLSQLLISEVEHLFASVSDNFPDFSKSASSKPVR